MVQRFLERVRLFRNEQSSRRCRRKHAFSTIIMAISTSQLYLVTSFDQPKNAWDALRDHFERDTLANKLLLKKQYFRTEMKEGMSMQDHMKKMKELTDKLAAIDAAISDEDQVVTLLGSLPQSGDSIKTSRSAMRSSLSFMKSRS